MSKINLNDLNFYLENNENYTVKEKIKRKKPKSNKEDNIYNKNNKQQKSKNNEE